MFGLSRTAASAAAAALALFAAVPGASASVTYQIDGFLDGDVAGFQAGFVAGEIAATCFSAPADDYPIRIESIRLLFGGGASGATREVTFKIFAAGGSGAAPSNVIFDMPDIELTASTSAFSEYDLSSEGVTVSGPWCVGVQMQHDGPPSVARDTDGSISRGNNWIYANVFGDTFVWSRSSDLLLEGDWVIRTIGTPSGGTTVDVGGDAGSDADAGADVIDEPDTAPDVIDEPDAAPDVIDEPDTAPDVIDEPDTAPDVDDEPDTAPDVTDEPDAAPDVAPDTAEEVDAAPDVSEEVVEDVAAELGDDVAVAPPTILDVTQSGERVDENVTIELEGTGFSDEYSYRVGARRLADVDVPDDGTTASGVLVAGSLAAGTYSVIVSGPFGEVTYTDGVILEEGAPGPPPTLASITPASTPLGQSASVVLLGADFAPGAEVLIDGRALPVTTVQNASTITAFVPGDHVDNLGTFDVVVRNPDAQLATLVGGFEFAATGAVTQPGHGCASAPGRAGAGSWLSVVAALTFVAARRRRLSRTLAPKGTPSAVE